MKRGVLHLLSDSLSLRNVKFAAQTSNNDGERKKQTPGDAVQRHAAIPDQREVCKTLKYALMFRNVGAFRASALCTVFIFWNDLLIQRYRCNPNVSNLHTHTCEL